MVFPRFVPPVSGAAALAAVLLAVPLQPAAAQDAEAGAKVFRRCMACHTTEEGGRSAAGPNLWGVIGSTSGTRETGFKYSGALTEAAVEWTDENLQKWLENPREFIKGSRMVLKLADPQDRLDVIAYLKQVTQ